MYKSKLKLRTSRTLSQCTRYHTVWFDYSFLSDSKLFTNNIKNYNITDKADNAYNISNIQVKKYYNLQRITPVFKMNRKIGNAVIRNKIKRRIKHIIRLQLSLITSKSQQSSNSIVNNIFDLQSSNALYLLLYPKPGIHFISFSELMQEISTIINTYHTI